MKQIFRCVCLMVGLLSLIACEQQSAIQPSGKIIKVGVIAPFSGFQQAKGSEGLIGIKIAMQLQPYLNNGDAIELVIEDGKGDEQNTLKAFRKLVEKEKVTAILLFSDSNSALAVSRIADRYQTPLLSLFATHPHITRGNEYVNQLVFDSAFQGAVAALFIRDELLIKKVALFTNPESANSIYLSSEFTHKFESVNGVITDSILISDETDYMAILDSVRKKDPELLYFPIEADKILGFVKAAKKLNWKPLMMGSDGLVANVMTRHKNELSQLDGLMAIDFFSHDMPLNEYGIEFKSVLQKQFTRKATSYMALAAEGYALLVNAMNDCANPADKECINQELRSSEKFKGIMGKISIGNDGKVLRPLIVLSIKEGQTKFMVKVY